ncbi:MAG TPA: HepT-like ribonuclease domain-containing protein [Longimicrobium sp.]
MSRNRLTFLENMLEGLGHAQEFTSGITRDEFVVDRRTFYAVMKAFEIVGEAAKHIHPEVRARHADVDWRGLAGFRDILTHSYFYFSVDPKIVWNLAVQDSVQAHRQLKIVLTAESDGSSREAP